jgi:hypothetical protein
VHGGGGGTKDGRKESRGRLPKLREAFQNLAEATRRDHYEFGQKQANAVLNIVNVEVEKLREAFLANARAD